MFYFLFISSFTFIIAEHKKGACYICNGAHNFHVCPEKGPSGKEGHFGAFQPRGGRKKIGESHRVWIDRIENSSEQFGEKEEFYIMRPYGSDKKEEQLASESKKIFQEEQRYMHYSGFGENKEELALKKNFCLLCREVGHAPQNCECMFFYFFFLYIFYSAQKIRNRIRNRPPLLRPSRYKIIRVCASQEGNNRKPVLIHREALKKK